MNKEKIVILQKEIRYWTNVCLEAKKKVSELEIKLIGAYNDDI